MAQADPGGASPAHDATFSAALAGVAVAGALATLLAWLEAGPRVAGGVAIGASLAIANLWAFGAIGRALMSETGHRGPAAGLAIVKVAALFGAAWLVLRHGLTTPLPLAVGYAALPAGALVGALFAPRPKD